MKYQLILFFFLASFSSQHLFAQQNHFIYLQSDNGQPFYVKLNNKILSATSSGYLIIGKLVDGSYQLNIGFPKSEFQEQTVNISVDRKDAGYLLKDMGGKGFGLFNLQSGEMIMTSNFANKESRQVERKTDTFSTMLANVINDSSLLVKDMPKEEMQNKLTETPRDTSKDASPTLVANDSVAHIQEPFSTIKRTLRKKNKEGTELVYVDEFNQVKDTIRIFIPVEKITKKDTVRNNDVALIPDNSSLNKESPQVVDTIAKANNVAVIMDTVPATNGILEKTTASSVVSKEKVKTVDHDTSGDRTKGDQAVNDNRQEIKEEKAPVKEYKFIEDKKDKAPVTKSVMINSDCKAFAGDDDFLKLRKKMAAESTDEDMIKVARKAFKVKCYSTSLIKNLSALFLNDEGKYKFFDAAYPFVSDSETFSSLRSQLSDTYYLNRFDAMVHK